MKKRAKKLSRNFSKEGVQKVSKYMTIREMQIKTILRLLVKWLSSGTQTTTNIGEDVEKKEPHILLVGM
jgi:hypothetical protein